MTKNNQLVIRDLLKDFMIEVISSGEVIFRLKDFFIEDGHDVLAELFDNGFACDKDYVTYTKNPDGYSISYRECWSPSDFTGGYGAGFRTGDYKSAVSAVDEFIDMFIRLYA